MPERKALELLSCPHCDGVAAQGIRADHTDWAGRLRTVIKGA